MGSISPWHVAASSLDAPLAACQELIVSGGFEEASPAWTLLPGERPATRSPDVRHNGSYAMRLGMIDSSNAESISSIHQSIILPTGASSIVLTFHYFPLYDAEPGANDLQYVEIYNDFNSQLISRIVQSQSNQREWILKQFDLTAYGGQQISIFFTVKNDGLAGRTAMYVDDVSLLACDGDGGTIRSVAPAASTPSATPTASATPTPSATSTPSSTPTPSATPTATVTLTALLPSPETSTATPSATSTLQFTVVPTITPLPTYTPLPPPPPGICGNSANLPPLQDCRDIIINGSFETNFDSASNWHFGEDPVRPDFTNEQVFSGGRSVRMGNPPNLNLQNIETYSSVRQLVQIPANTQAIQLRWLRFDISEEPATANPGNLADRQDVILLSKQLETMQVLSRLRCSTNSWQEYAYALDPSIYSGQEFFVYFNIYNDGLGGRTWSYLDEVRLTVCSPNSTSGQPVQYPTAVPTSTLTPYPAAVIETATWTATPTWTATSTPTWTVTNTPVEESLSPPVNNPANNLSTSAVVGQGPVTVVYVTATLLPIATDDSSLANNNRLLPGSLFTWMGSCGILIGILAVIAYFAWGILRTLSEGSDSVARDERKRK